MSIGPTSKTSEASDHSGGGCNNACQPCSKHLVNLDEASPTGFGNVSIMLLPLIADDRDDARGWLGHKLTHSSEDFLSR